MMSSIEQVIEFSKDLLILYVEDNEYTRESTLLILEDIFGDIIIAVDGVDALEKFKKDQHKIDMVITDINMPNMNGLELSKEIKEIDVNMPIFIFSAHNEASLFLDAIRIGVDGYLLKPFDIDQFTKVLYKSIESVNLRKENLEYRDALEDRVILQVEELREKDKLLMQQTKMASMGEMIDAIAHQWKQPLNALGIYSDLLKGDFKDNQVDDEYINNFTDDIQKQISHMVDTLAEFRNFFKPDNNAQRINLRSIFDIISLLLKDELLKCNIQLKYQCADDITLFANKNDIKHLFINLIVNAKDEMVKQEIDSRDRVVEIECIDSNDDNVMIRVKDNGKGIPVDAMESIFKPHFTTKGEEGGTGVGLYMCKQITDKYSGTISVHNEIGAVFQITLPKAV